MNNAGFAIHEDLLGADACDALTATLPASTRAGARHIMTHPAVAALAVHDRLLAVARRWVGSHAVPYRATLFDKRPARNWLVTWHQDTALPLESPIASPDWGPWSRKHGILYAHAPTWALNRVVALRLHLDPSTADNGPLRVIPGSHAAGVLSDDAVLRVAHERAPVHCLARRGDVLAMHPLLIHASSKSTVDAPRRVLHIEYAASLDLAAGIRLAVA